MKRLLLVALGATLAFTACKKNDDDKNASPKARVMFVHGALDADSLRGRVNNQTIATMPFLGSSGYMSVDAGSAAIDFVYTGSGSTFQTTSINLVANNSYSVFAGGSANTKVIVSKTDDLTAPSSGKAKVRFVNLSPDNVNAVAYVGNTTLDTFALGTLTEFREVNVGAQTVTVGVLPSVASLNNFNITAGKIYTFMFSGTLNGNGNTALKLTAITHN